MKSALLAKLQTELTKKIEGEPQVVYILTRIRKVLEVDGKLKDYDKLKFYCDWALHPEITNVGAVKDILEGVIARDGESGLNLTVQFTTFHKEFKRFLSEYGLSTTIYDSDENRFFLEKHLSQIYADTPLVVNKEFRIRWFGTSGERSFGGSFKVEKIEPSVTP